MPPTVRYQQLEEGRADLSSWPTRLQLCELMTEDGKGALDTLTKGGGVQKLVGMLGSDANKGISGSQEDLEKRRRIYGDNSFETKKLKSYLALVWDGLHDMTIIS